MKGFFRFLLLAGVTGLLYLLRAFLALLSKSKRQATIAQWDVFVQKNLSPIIPIISAAELFDRLKKTPTANGTLVVELQMFAPSHGDVSTYETYLLSTLVKSLGARRLFEFGTFNGRTTHHLAANTPDEAKITTLELPPNALKNDAMDEYDQWLIDQKGAAGPVWLQDPPALRNKIDAQQGDSMTFDYSPYRQQMDFIFIDACHSYAYVKSDTENAERMLKKGGILVWDNFNPDRNNAFHALINRLKCRDLNHYLFERHRDLSLAQIAGTGFVILLNPK